MRTCLSRAWHASIAATLLLLPASVGELGAQSRTFPVVTAGIGQSPQPFNQLGYGPAISAGVFRRLGSHFDLGFEGGYQGFYHGEFWYLGATLRVRPLDAPIQPVVLVGLGRYGAGQRVYFGDGYIRRDEFDGIGVNGGLAVEGPLAERLAWTVAVRAHGVFGGLNGELAGGTEYSLMAGITVR